MNDAQKLGSRTAKGGFANESMIEKKLNNWEKDIEARDWLNKMGYDFERIKNVNATKLSSRNKTDIKVKINLAGARETIIQNISIKRSENLNGYNQIDRRSVDKYKKTWDIPEEIAQLLKYFTGELKPIIERPRDSRRTFLNEMNKLDQEKIIDFFSRNKKVIITDLFKGREEEKPAWFLVAYYDKERDTTTYLLEKIDIIIDLYAEGEVCITGKGSLKIGNITMQRKGGTPDPESLQFKIDPMFVFQN